MVKITHVPVKELVIHDIIAVDKQDMLRGRVTPAGTMPLYWCDGVLFSFSSFPMNDQVIKDHLEGKIHWLEVQFAMESKYTPVIALSEEEYKATLNVRVIDTSSVELHKELIKWIKGNYKK
ncbi:MAG: hypothetical protein KGI00_00525 [Candidatus Micrarchaeota archaeon]|nr:hypothetical protein [Candidatus Micrarchaeota archaeon]MDE1849197.1 hypothetical protein [Candidatus Micrarchaeota archaeon]